RLQLRTLLSCLLQASAHNRDLHSFPTRRSSDLDGGKEIIAGNERVIRARLSDAKFFYETDLKTRLEDRLPKFEQIVFHEKLGTRSEEHTSELQSLAYLVCRLLLEKKKTSRNHHV